MASDEARYAGFSLLVGTLNLGLEGFVAPAGDLGARAATLILADARGGWHCIERRFGPGGVPVGESQGRHSG